MWPEDSHRGLWPREIGAGGVETEGIPVPKENVVALDSESGDSGYGPGDRP